MHSPKITLYGNDQGANNVLDSVQQVAQERGFSVYRIPGLNQQVTEQAIEDARGSAAVVLGLSTNRPEADVAKRLLVRYPELAGKFVAVEDLPGTAYAQWENMKSIAPQVTMCTALPTEALRAREGFKAMHTVGTPDHWTAMWNNVRIGKEMRARGEILIQHSNGHAEPLPRHAIVTYVPGFIRPKEEANILRHLAAIPTLRGGEHMVVFRPHPGEQNRPELAQAIHNRDAILHDHIKVVNDTIQSAGRGADAMLLGMSDIAVTFPAQTTTFVAGSLDKNVISPYSVLLPEDLADGFDYAVAHKIAETVPNIDHFQAIAEELLTPGSVREIALRTRQRINSVIPDMSRPLQSAQRMMDAVDGMM